MKVLGQHTMSDYAPQPIHVRGGTVPNITSNQSVFTQPMQTFPPSINYPDPNQPSTSRYVPGPSAMIHNASQLIHADGRTISNITSNQSGITQPIQNASSINYPDMNQPSTSRYVPAAPKDCVLCPHCGSMIEDRELCPKCLFQSSETKIGIDPEKHARTLLRSLNSMRTKKESDLVIKVGSNIIFAHKLLLAAGSSYFDKMLSKIVIAVEIKDLDPNCVAKCIDFIYGILPKLDDDIEPLMHAARSVVPELCKKLDETLSLKNFTTT